MNSGKRVNDRSIATAAATTARRTAASAAAPRRLRWAQRRIQAAKRPKFARHTLSVSGGRFIARRSWARVIIPLKTSSVNYRHFIFTAFPVN